MSKKKQRIRKEMGSFLRQYERKAQKNFEPNDRNYDRSMEDFIKKMDPEELSEFMCSDGSNIPPDLDESWLSGEKIPGVQFQLHDSVEIIKGKNMGETGTIVSLIEILPEARYLVELHTGSMVNVIEGQLKGL